MEGKLSSRKTWLGPAQLTVAAAAIIPALVALLVLGSAAHASDPVVTVSMTDSAFTPPGITVYVGEEIRWLNSSTRAHTVTDQAGNFHSGIVQVGDDYARSFSSPGTIEYYCTIHPGMTGTVTILDDGSPLPPTPTPTTGAGSPPSGAASVSIYDDGYTPPTLAVTTGTTVTWTNTGNKVHTVTDVNGGFTSGLVFSGAAYARTYSTPGTFEYYCTLHSGMTGSVVVDGAPAPSTTTQPTPTSPPPTTTPSPSGPPPAGSLAVSIVDDDFAVPLLNVTTGTTVVWTNNGSNPHTATARNSLFGSPVLFGGGTYSFTFLTAGTYEYYCIVHPSMVATIAVTGESATPPPGSTPAPTAPPPAATVPPPAGSTVVEVFDNGYRPEPVNIKVGQTVAWRNVGLIPHTVTARRGAFNSDFLAAGGTYTMTFRQPGVFEYYCVYHGGMTGSVIVADQSGLAPTPDPNADLVDEAPAAPAPSVAAGSSLVRVVDDAYIPSDLTITAGSEVVWSHAGVAPHTVTDGGGRFGSDLLGRGDVFRYTFNSPGSYQIICIVHPAMVASITVKPGTSGALPTVTGSPTVPATPTPLLPPSPGSAQMLDFDYTPKILTVRAGASVTWVNAGKAPHTVTANDDAFDSGLKLAGQSFTMTFDAPGTFPYYCTLHPQMVGEVRVTSASGTVPPPGSAPVTPRSTPAGAGGPIAASVTDIQMLDNDFAPATYTIRAGGTVRWINAGRAPHTATAADGSFDSGLINSGQSFSRQFVTPGTYDYVCIIHPGMAGRVVVTDAAGGAPPPVAPPATPRSSTGGAGPSAPGNRASVPLEMIDFDYAPREHEVVSGDKVTWINTGKAPHTVTARDGSFDSGLVMANGEYMLVAGAPGAYEYFCTLHPQMVGTLVVTAAQPGDAGAPGAGVSGGDVQQSAAPGEPGSSSILSGPMLIVLVALIGVGCFAVIAPLVLGARATRSA